MTSLGVGNTVAHHRAGTLRIIGVATDKRIPTLPEVPTFREQGIDVTQGGWTLIVGPRGLSASQVAYWEGMIERAASTAEWKKSLDDDFGIVWFMKGQPLRDFLKKEYDTNQGLLVELGMAK
jgi:putative tricarboxylic transport membrane protein